MKPGLHPSRSLVRGVGGSRAFTLLELLVVISIIVIATTVLLPAFGRLIESSNYASAINSVTATLGNARALAISTGRPTGVAFLFDAKREVYSLQALEVSGLQGGVLTNRPVSTPDHVYCHAFRPAAGSAPVELPKRMGVYGLAFTHVQGSFRGTLQIDLKIDSQPTWQWYAGELINASSPNPITPWIFPRSDPRLFTALADGQQVGVDPWAALTGGTTSPALSDPDAIAAVRNCTTFFIEFSANGSVVTSTRDGGQDTLNAYLELSAEPVEVDSLSGEPYDDPNRFDPENFGGLAPDKRMPNPEVMMRAASELAVVDLGRLAEGAGLRHPWLARPAGSRALQPPWLWDSALSGPEKDDKVREISRWIDLNAEVIGFNRYTGNVIRRINR